MKNWNRKSVRLKSQWKKVNDMRYFIACALCYSLQAFIEVIAVIGLIHEVREWNRK